MDGMVAIRDVEICRWFSTVFAQELPEEAVSAYLSGAAEPFLDAVSLRCDIGAERGALAGAIRELFGRDDPAKALAIEFGSLFLVPGLASATPYGSVYEEGRLYGAAHERMIARLDAAGLSHAGGQVGPADHLSIMLEYLAQLLDNDAQAENSSAFLKSDLLPLAEAVADRIRGHDVKSPFYQALSSMLARYLSSIIEIDRADSP